jgi:hypothetical protein
MAFTGSIRLPASDLLVVAGCKSLKILERETGLEPAMSSLGSRTSGEPPDSNITY